MVWKNNILTGLGREGRRTTWKSSIPFLRHLMDILGSFIDKCSPACRQPTTSFSASRPASLPQQRPRTSLHPAALPPGNNNKKKILQRLCVVIWNDFLWESFRKSSCLHLKEVVLKDLDRGFSLLWDVFLPPFFFRSLGFCQLHFPPLDFFFSHPFDRKWNGFNFSFDCWCSLRVVI